jgi:hypothetical protein
MAHDYSSYCVRHRSSINHTRSKMLDEREEEAKIRAHLIGNETRTRGMCKLEDNEKNAFDLIYID